MLTMLYILIGIVLGFVIVRYMPVTYREYLFGQFDERVDALKNEVEELRARIKDRMD